jgi:hypothetical protein
LFQLQQAVPQQVFGSEESLPLPVAVREVLLLAGLPMQHWQKKPQKPMPPPVVV